MAQSNSIHLPMVIASRDDVWKGIVAILHRWRAVSQQPEGLILLNNTDQKIAKWVQEHVGEVEDFLLDERNLQYLASTKSADVNHSCLEILLLEAQPWNKLEANVSLPQIIQQISDRGPLAQLCNVLQADKLFELVVKSTYQQRLSTKQYGGRLAAYLLKKIGESALDDERFRHLPSELWDSLTCVAFDKKLQPLLPNEQELIHLSPFEITQKFARYTGETVEQLESRLRPQHDSRTGFIGSEEHIGELILSDCKTLLDLGISRNDIAERMLLVMKIGHFLFLESWFQHVMQQPQDSQRQKAAQTVLTLKHEANAELTQLLGPAKRHPWRILLHQFIGYQTDPFHPTFDNPLKERGRDFFVLNTELAKSLGHEDIRDDLDENNKPKHWPPECSLFFSSLAPTLIQRANFFEGKTVKHRIHPVLATRVLGLHKDFLWSPKKE